MILIVGSAITDIEALEHQIKTLWKILEATPCIMHELLAYYVGQKDFKSHKFIMQESKELETECQRAIEKAQAVIVKCALESSVKQFKLEQI